MEPYSFRSEIRMKVLCKEFLLREDLSEKIIDVENL